MLTDFGEICFSVTEFIFKYNTQAQLGQMAIAQIESAVGGWVATPEVA